jgi:hypothetical protein
MYIPFFVIISLLFVQASPLRHVTKSCLCVVLLKHTECTVPRHISRVLQFISNTLKLSLHCIDCISAMLKCVFDNIVQIWQQCMQ